MEENIETSNINLKWLDNIYEQLRKLQDIERSAREGCLTLFDYLQIPMELRQILIPEAQYKNLKFLVLELDILVDNLSPIIPDKIEGYEKSLKLILKNIDNKNYYIKNRKVNNQIVAVDKQPLLDVTLNVLLELKSQIIKDIGHILFIKDETKKKW